MLIDSNAHPTLNGRWIDGREGVTFGQLSELLKKNQIDKALTVGLPEVGDYEHSRFWETATQYSHFYPVAALTSKSVGLLEAEMNKITEIGYKSVKFHARLLNLQEINLYLEKVFELAEKRRINVFICGYNYQSVTKYSNELSDAHKQVLHCMRKWPNVKVVYLHGGMHGFLEMIMWARHSDNLLLDLSYTYQYQKRFFKDELAFLLDRLDKKIVLGSDTPDLTIEEYLDGVRELSAINRVKSENVLGQNLIRHLELD